MLSQAHWLDPAIAKSLMKTHLSDRALTIVDEILQQPTNTYSREQLDDVVVYALLEANNRGENFNGTLIRRLIMSFLEGFPS